MFLVIFSDFDSLKPGKILNFLVKELWLFYPVCRISKWVLISIRKSLGSIRNHSESFGFRIVPNHSEEMYLEPFGTHSEKHLELIRNHLEIFKLDLENFLLTNFGNFRKFYICNTVQSV